MVEAAQTLRVIKLALRVGGVIVCLLFSFIAGIWVLLQPVTNDFWLFCHWVGKSWLGLIVGAVGCYLEIKGVTGKIARSAGLQCANRIVVAVFYFWMGCYVVGGPGASEAFPEWVSHVTGIAAWVIAVGDIFFACLGEDMDEDDWLERKSGKTSKADMSTPDTIPGAAQSTMGVGATAQAPASTAPAKPDEPAGGWNSSAFGGP